MIVRVALPEVRVMLPPLLGMPKPLNVTEDVPNVAPNCTDVICARYGVSWALYVGPQVRRFLRVCDPDGLLPIRDSAVQHLDTAPRDRKLLVGGNN